MRKKPLTILLYGGNANPQQNKGDALMLLAVVSRMREAFPDAELVAREGGGDYADRCRLGLYQLLSPSSLFSRRGLATWIFSKYRGEFGIRTDADLSVMLNFQGYRFADFGWRSVRRDYEDFRRRERTGIRNIYLPQAFGPFENANVRRMVSEMLNAASLVYARDTRSVNYLKDIGVSNVLQCPDMTIGFPGETPGSTISASRRKAVYLIPNCWMFSRAGLQQSEAMALYANSISRIQEKCNSAGMPLRFMNHAPFQDSDFIEDINSQLGKPIEVVDEQDPLKLKKMVSESLFVFGSRYHSLVAALSQNVPAIGTSWAPKYEGLFSDYGVDEWLISASNTREQLDSLLETLFDEDRYHAVVAKLADKNKLLKQKVASMWDNVRQVLSGDSSPNPVSPRPSGVSSDGLERKNSRAVPSEPVPCAGR